MTNVLLLGAGAGVLGLLALATMAPRSTAPAVPGMASTAPEDRVSSQSPTPMGEVKRVCWSIVSVFETGRPEGRYDGFVVLPDRAGISYGRKQGTDRSGTLDLIVEQYIAAGGRLGTQLAPFLPRLQRNETTTLDPNPATWPTWMHELKRLLVEAGGDPVMHRVQDRVFERIYWLPAVDAWRDLGLRTPLGLAVIFDTCIHSGGPHALAWIRRRFAAKPPSGGGDERTWVRQYVLARRRWLETHSIQALHATTYRMDAFTKLIDEGNWALVTPITIPRPRATIQ